MILLTELESYFKRYPKRKLPSKTVTKRQNKQKIWRRKGVSKLAPLKEISAVRTSYLIINSVQKIKSTSCLYLKSLLKKEVLNALN